METSNSKVALDGGGHFEHLVRTIKAILATAISKKLLILEEFTTIIKKAENIVNSRPLTYQSDSSRDIPLTPSQLAWGRDLTLMHPLLQPEDPLDEDYDAKATRAQYIVLSNALERFRKCWHNEYLVSLRVKHYNQCAENPSHHLRVGQLVMIKHDNLHRIEWPLGVITALYPDERGVIRTAEVEECGRRLIRSVTLLVPVELDCHQEDDVIRQCLCDNQRGDEDDIENIYSPVDSTSKAGAWVAPPQQQTQKNGAFFTTRHLSSQSHIVCRAAPNLAVRPLAPHRSATSPLRVVLCLLPRLPYRSHQQRQFSCNIPQVRGVRQRRRSLHLSLGSHDELSFVNENSCGDLSKTTYFRPSCLLCVCVGIAQGSRKA